MAPRPSRGPGAWGDAATAIPILPDNAGAAAAPPALHKTATVAAIWVATAVAVFIATPGLPALLWRPVRSTTAPAATAPVASSSLVARPLAPRHGPARSPLAGPLPRSPPLATLPVGVAAAAAAAAPWAPLAGIAAFGVAVALLLKRVLDTPSRKYDPRDVNVGREYDNWTQEGVLEYYWGEHIHLGYYSHELRRRGRYTNGDFIRAKIDFVDQMFKWSGAPPPDTLLDVGCGIGGTSRQLAERFPHAKVTGITLSPKQVERGTELAKERGISNCEFKVMDALKMDFPDNSFDIVWGCESGEHMPDKRRYIEEMVRVLKPGGTLVIATWCQREATPDRPLTPKEKDKLQFLYDEWAHPYFISKEEYVRIMDGTNQLEEIRYDDWNEFTIDSWRHSIWVGVRDPMGLLCKSPLVWYRSLRDAVTLERMHRAFASGLMEYGMLKARKKVPLVGTRV